MSTVTSYNVLQSRIEAFCDNHYQVKKFGGEFYSEINNFATQDEKFPIIFSSPVSQRVNDNVIEFDMDIYCLDIIKKDRTNLNDILSDTNLILNDLHLFFKLGDDSTIDVIDEPSLTPINNSLLDYAAGWVMRITFEVTNYGPCQIPFIDAPLIPVEEGGNIFFRYLTCDTLSECGTIQQIQDDIATLSARTDTNDITRVQPGSNITTGGTANSPIVNLVDSPSVNNLTFSGTASGPFVIATGVTSNFIQFNTAATESYNVGKLQWNDTDGTLDLGLKGGQTTLQVGQEQIIRVVNKTGGNLLLSQYKVVYVTGATGQRLSVGLAQANSELTSATSLGVIKEDIANNQEGFITTVGRINEINTTGSLQGETWNDGDMLYLSSTIAGGITNVRPVAPNHRVVIGYVEYAHAIHGKLYIKIDNGYELNELHDVFYATSALTNNQILSWSTGNTRWEARNETPTGIHNPVMIPGVVYTQSIGAIAPTTVTHSNGRLVLMPYIPCVTHTSTSLGLEVTTTAATANSRVLVYSDSNGVPFRKLVESTDLSSTSTGIKTFNTGFTFQRGTTYWIGTHTNAAVAFRAVPLANNLNIGITTGTFHLNMYLATVTFGSAPTFYSGASGSLASQIAPIIRIAI